MNRGGALVEINFDGIVGPSHNYAGLSLGNLAATAHAGTASYPRAAALQGLAKMRHNLGLGLAQGFLENKFYLIVYSLGIFHLQKIIIMEWVQIFCFH